MKRIFVKPEARRRRIGWMLVETVERAAAVEGLVRMYLETGVRSDEALGLYRRLAYEVCGFPLQ